MNLRLFLTLILTSLGVLAFPQISFNLLGVHTPSGDSLELKEINYNSNMIKILMLESGDLKQVPIGWLNAVELYPRDIRDFWQHEAIKSGYYQSLSKTGYQYDLRNELEEDVIQFIAQLEENNLIFRDSYLENYLYSILFKLYPIKNADGRQGLLNVYVVSDINPNAYMCPNGTMIITTGLLSTINSEEELIAAIAHEVSHFVLDHSIININKNIQREKSAAFWATFATVVAATADVYMATQDEYYSPGALTMSTAMLSFSIATIITDRLGLKYSREQELEADKCAVALMKFLNLPPSALASVLEKIKQYCVNTGNHVALGGNGTHPNINDRINAIGAAGKFNSSLYDGTISFVLTQNAIHEFKVAHFLVCQSLVDRTINAGTAIEDDYILKAITNLYLYNTAERNNEALSLIQKAKNINVTPNLNLYKFEALTLVRLNRNSDAIVSLNNYISALNDEEENLVNMKNESYWTAMFVYLMNERQWASKMAHKLKSNNIMLN